MSVRYRTLMAVTAPLALLTAFAAPAAAQTGADSGTAQAVAYQIGIGHDGHSTDTTITTPLTSRWKHQFTGPVSYPLIADGRVYVTVADNDGSYGTNLYALDQADGSIIWSQPISGTYWWSNAAYDGGQIFVVNNDGLLRRFDASTGALGWSTQLPGQYFFTSAPTADSGVVYVGGSGGGGTLYAVSETDGSVLWTRSVENGDDSSPALNAKNVYVSYACGVTYGFARSTGEQQWFDDGPCEGGGGKTAVLHGGNLYMRDPIEGNKIFDAGTGASVGTFQAGPAPAFSGTTGLFLSGGTLTASSGGATLWSFTGDGRLDTAPIVVGTTAYVGSSSGTIYGLKVKTGKVAWSADTGAPIAGPDEQNVTQPLTGLGAGQGVLVVPAGNDLVAYSD